MSAIVMKCIKTEQHPNADSLRLYEFESPGNDPIQIIANMENVYEVGDNAVIVLPDSILKDGTKIKPAKFRGIKSYGMAIGHSDKEAGTNLTEEYCQPEPENQPVYRAPMVRWPDIESLFNVRRGLKAANMEKAVEYVGKCKQDGTNIGIQLFSDGRIVPQSHHRVINPDDDNMNSAKWVVSNYDYFHKVREQANQKGYEGKHLTIFAEFAGSGIQSRTAISKIDKRIIAVFAIQIGDNKLETDPDKIKEIFPPHDQVYVIPWLGGKRLFDFTNVEVLTEQAEELNKLVAEVERCDPFVKDTFGIEGIGEGVVMYPILNNSTLIDKDEFSELVFKAKGEKHKVVNSKKPAQIDPEFVKTVDDFVDLFVTENRLEQIADRILNGEAFSIKFTGKFLKEFGADVLKESEAEREEAGLEWKQVVKAVNSRASHWWQEKCKALT